MCMSTKAEAAGSAEAGSTQRYQTASIPAALFGFMPPVDNVDIPRLALSARAITVEMESTLMTYLGRQGRGAEGVVSEGIWLACCSRLRLDNGEVDVDGVECRSYLDRTEMACVLESGRGKDSRCGGDCGGVCAKRVSRLSRTVP